MHCTQKRHKLGLSARCVKDFKVPLSEWVIDYYNLMQFFFLSHSDCDLIAEMKYLQPLIKITSSNGTFDLHCSDIISATLVD